MTHLRQIHGHLFQDVYAWAGQFRTIDIAKRQTYFLTNSRLEVGLDYVHGQVVKQNFLKALSADDSAKKAATVIGDLNYVHPFWEGNGRTQVVYLKSLGSKAGHKMDLSRLSPKTWIRASIEATDQSNPRLMETAIRAPITGDTVEGASRRDHDRAP